METLRKPEHIRRWVLALGDEARQVCEDVKLSAEELEMNEALARRPGRTARGERSLFSARGPLAGGYP